MGPGGASTCLPGPALAMADRGGGVGGALPGLCLELATTAGCGDALGRVERPAFLTVRHDLGGGGEPFFSYGPPAPKPGASATELRFASRALRAAMPHEHLRFLARLRLHAQIGDYLFVHAGLRPGAAR